MSITDELMTGAVNRHVPCGNTYEAGYRDGSINYELEHCPACKNVADLQEALAENTKLRLLVRDVYESAYYEYPSYFESKFADRMYELGIETEV